MKVLKEATKSFDTKKGKYTKCNCRESLAESKTTKENFSEITALADDCGKNTFKTSARDIRFTFENEEDKTKFVNKLLSSNIPHNELPFGVISINKSDALDESKSIKESANTMIYLFPELTGEDLEILKAYGLQFLGINHGAYGDEEHYVVRGQEAALRRYADKYLGYELHPDYLYDEEDFAGDIIKESITRSPLSTTDPIAYAVKLLYEMDKFVLDVYDNENWLMNGVPDGEFEETTADEAMQNYTEHVWLIEDKDNSFSTEDFKDFLATFKSCTISKSYDQAERARIIAKAEHLLKEYSAKIHTIDQPDAYSKEEIIAQLKQELPNLGDSGTIKYGYKSEAEAAVDFLEEIYAMVELDKVGSWFQINYAELLNK